MDTQKKTIKGMDYNEYHREYRKTYRDIKKDYFQEYQKQYYQKNKSAYMKKCTCDVCGKELFKANLSRHKKSHLCKPQTTASDPVVVTFD